MFTKTQERMMKHFFLASLCLVTLGAMSAMAQEATETPADPWEALKTYTFGDGREPLLAIQNEVVANMNSPEVRSALAQRLAGLLDDEVDYQVKLFACRQLMKIGGDAEVPALAALLTNEKLTDPARYALERIPGEAATSALIAAAAQTEGEVLAGIVAGLGRRGDDAAVPVLAELAVSENVKVGETAVSALAALGSSAACDALIHLRSSAPQARLDAVAHALLEAAEGCLAAGNSEKAQQVYQSLLDSETPVPVHTAAFLALARAKGAGAIDDVMDALRGDDPALAHAAGRLLYELPGDEVTGRLAAAAAEMPPAGQVVVIPALAARGGAAAREAVDAMLDSEDEGVRAAATTAIAKIGDASSVMRLATLAAEWSGRERVEIRRSLVALPGEEVDAAISRDLEGATPAVQEELIRAAADRHVEAVVPALFTLTGAESAGVRERAFKALGALAATKEMPDLLALLGKMSGDDVPLLEETIVSVAAKPGDAAGAGSQLLASLEATGDPALKAAILRIMGALGTADAFPVVKRHLEHPEQAVRMAALTALTQLDAPGVREELKQVYDSAEHADERKLALEGYVRLLGEATPAEAAAGFATLIADAANDKELATVVEGLGNFHRGAALDLATVQLDNEAVQRQAVSAVLKLARPLIGAYPGKVDAALTKVLAVRDNDAVRSQTEQIRKLLADAGNYLVAWEWAGPYTVQGGGRTAAFNEAFAPETNPAEVPWQVYSLETNAGAPWTIDFQALLGGDDRAAYLRTTLVASEAMDVTGLAGSDDGIKVWVNGKEVHAIDATRGLTPDEDKFPVSLKAGENTLLVKVINGGGSWSSCLRLVNAEGNPVEGVTAQIP